jgi:hypothetical protein
MGGPAPGRLARFNTASAGRFFSAIIKLDGDINAKNTRFTLPIRS